MHINKSLFLLATASVTVAYDAVIGRGLWTGIDTTKRGATLEEVFAKRVNQVTAAASLLQYYGTQSGYVPRDSSPLKALLDYDTFKVDLSETPAFKVESKYTQGLFVKGGNLDQLQDAIRYAYQEQDRDLVALNLRAAIPTKWDEPDGTKDVLLSLIEIYKPRSQPTVSVKLIELPVLLLTNSGRVHLLRGKTELSVLQYELNAEWLGENAELLAHYVKKATTAKQFAELFTSPTEDHDDEEDIRQWIFGHRTYRLRGPVAF